MIEKVNPSHPDKVADRIAGAIVDLAYKKTENPKIAVEVLIGHGACHTIIETNADIWPFQVDEIIERIAGVGIECDTKIVPQDAHLAENQSREIRCGDNGIFKGVPVSIEENNLSNAVRLLYNTWPTDGKFIWDEAAGTFIACQSNADSVQIENTLKGSEITVPLIGGIKNIVVNPLGDWTGGTNVDTGATNRKLGSDMGRAVTGGGLHGKDLSKADVAVNIACHLMAQNEGLGIEALCAIGDDVVKFRREDGESAMMPYDEVVGMAADYIKEIGGFEKLAEWGMF